MRSVAFVLVTPLLACSAPAQPVEPLQPDGQTASDGGMPPPANGFQWMSPPIDVNPGPDGEVTYCYYFQTSNTTEQEIQRWASHMTPGVHDMILYLTQTNQQPPDTMSRTDCGFVQHAGGPVWTYAAQTLD